MAFANKGASLQCNFGAGLVTITDVFELEGPSPEVDTQEILPLNGAAVQKLPTVVDNGQVTGKIYYNPADTTHQSIQSALAAPSVLSFKKIYANSDASFEEFSGIWKSFADEGA